MNELRFLVLALSITWSVSAGAQEAWHFHLLGSPPWIEPLPSSSRAIHDLTPYQGKLYISYGDAGDNLGPVELGNYEPASNAFTTQYLLGSEATGRYKVMGESLYVPSIDPAHFYNQSDFAVMTEDGWKRQAQIGMLHAYDIVSYEGNLYMAGSSREVIESAGSNALIWRSEDMGKRWMPWFRTFQDARAVGRSHYVMPYQNRLYYLVRYLEGNDITVQEDSGLDLTIDVYELFLDKIVYKVGASGELGSLGPRTIATFDGTSATSLEMETLDIFVDGDRLWALLEGPRIAWTEDLETWIDVNASALPERAHRLACLGDQLFVATRDGELWLGRTDAAQEAPDAPSVVRMRGDDVGQGLAWDDDRLLVSAPAAGQAPWNHGQVELRTPAATSLLQSPEPLPLGYFGAHVAVDGNWLAVSEPKRDDAKVHVYHRTTSEAAWAWQQTLVYEQLRGQGRESRPLHSVDLWGDYLAVGWEGQADRSSEPAFTLYEWQDETWKSVFAASYASIDANLDSEAYIRTQVALDEDLLVIGLVGDPADNKGQGLVVIYERVESGWQRQQVILAPEAAMVSEFGIALALSESWLAVGAPRGQGRVYLYRRSQRTIDPTQGLVVEMPESHGRFGHALALSGQHLVVGAPDIDWEKRESGAVFGFDLSLGYPRLTHQVASSEEATRGFGNQLALRSEQLAVSAVVGEVTVLPWLSPPSLNVSSEGERLSLTWTPKPGNTYRLEESPSLRSASWQEVEIRTQVGLHTITREAENRTRFYRLLVMPE